MTPVISCLLLRQHSSAHREFLNVCLHKQWDDDDGKGASLLLPAARGEVLSRPVEIVNMCPYCLLRCTLHPGQILLNTCYHAVCKRASAITFPSMTGRVKSPRNIFRGKFMQWISDESTEHMHSLFRAALASETSLPIHCSRRNGPAQSDCRLNSSVGETPCKSPTALI